jgi:chromosome segregation ATPase
MKHPRWTALLFAILTVGLIAGCGGGSEESGAAAVMEEAADAAADAGEDVAGAAEDAMEGAVEAGEDLVDAAAEDLEGLNAQLAEKEAELQKLADELKAMSPADLMGDKAKDLKSRQATLMEEIQALKDKLAELGG